MKKNIFLAPLLVMPLFIQTMDTPIYTIPLAIINHQTKANTLCGLAFKFLHHISLDSSAESIPKYSPDLVTIIDQMHCLRSTTPVITEKEMGHYAYEKVEFCIKDKILLKSPLLCTTTNSSFISLFFARLAVYNDHLTQQSLISPNKEQVKNYLEKKNIERIVTKNAERNLIIPQQIVDTMIITTPTNVAIEAFMSLIKDAQNISRDSEKESLESVKLLYYHELENKHTQP